MKKGEGAVEKAQITLRLPLELLEQLRRQAQEMGISTNQLLTNLILRGLHRES